MKRKGFTLVELLAVIAILAILVIIALPNVLKMFNDAKKNSFLTEAKTLAQDVSPKYISESMKGNKLSVISNKKNSLDLSGRDLEYSFELDSKGKIKNMIVSDGTYCISTTKDYTKITKSDISENCSYEELHNIAGTLMKNFYEKSSYKDRLTVSSIEFSNDKNTVVSGIEPIDVSEEKNDSIKMYIKPVSDTSSLLSITIVADGNIAFPEDSSSLLSFGRPHSGGGYYGALKSIKFNNSIDTNRVKNMSKIFYGNNLLESLDLSDFNTSNVTNMSEMFMGIGVEELDLSSFDTSKVIDMSRMFYCLFDNSKLKSIKNLNKFNTSKVTNMSQMFFGSKVTTLDLSSFDTSNVTDMNAMFWYSAATEIKGLNKFNTLNVTNMNCMFAYSKVAMLDLSGFNTSNVTDMEGMFKNSVATIGYAKDAETAAKFNDSTVTSIPDTLKFTVK